MGRASIFCAFHFQNSMRGPTLAIGLLLSLASFGQQNAHGLSAGPSLCRLRSSKTFDRPRSIVGLQLSGRYDHWFVGGFGLQGQLTFARMGGGDGDPWPIASSYHFSHMGLSMGAAYRTPGRAYLYIATGIMETILIDGQYQLPAFRVREDLAIGLVGQGIQRVTFAYGTLGGAIDTRAPLTLGLSLRFDQGLSTLSGEGFFERENLVESGWTMSVSVLYRWPSKDRSSRVDRAACSGHEPEH